MKALRFCIFILLASSCQKQRPPNVHVLTPADGQQFQIGDTVRIKAELNDADILLSEYLIVVSGSSYSDTIINYAGHIQQSSYTLSNYFVIQTADTFKIIVGVYGGSSIYKEQPVYIKGY